jgi:hypothetical protein
MNTHKNVRLALGERAYVIEKGRVTRHVGAGEIIDRTSCGAA